MVDKRIPLPKSICNIDLQIKLMEVFGFHRFDENLYSEEDFEFSEIYYDAQNALNIMGWFPVLGTVTGTIRLVGTCVMYLSDDESYKTQHKKYYVVSALRSIVEILSLGFIFIIPDIIASFRRNKRVRMERKKMRKNRRN